MPRDTIDAEADERAALERLARLRRDSRREPSDAPAPSRRVQSNAAWPPHVVEGLGNPHVSVEATHKSVVSVWGILGVIGTCVALGFAAAAFFGNVAKKDTTDAIQKDLTDLKRSQAVNQAVVETTLTGLRGSVDEIKEALRISKNPEPLTPDKKPEKSRR